MKVTRTVGTAVMFLLAANGPALSAATVVTGAVEGDWNAAGSPYHATGNLSVGPGKTLTIEAGVTVELNPDVSLVVQGSLLIQGTADAGVKFVRASASLAWGGIAVTGHAATANVQHLEVTGATVAKSSLPGFPTTFHSVFKVT